MKYNQAPVETQNKVFKTLVKDASKTLFGQDHNFSSIDSHQEFVKNVPIVDYEGLKPYIDKMVKGEPDVLWPGQPTYFAKTSGTTSGVKYIPLTKESIPNHITSARNTLLAYIHETGKSSFIERSMIFLSGSPILNKQNGVNIGRLSGIVNHHVPSYLRRNQKPTYKTNCIEDWEEKLDAIVAETIQEDMSLISGIPPWVQMYFDRVIAKSGKSIKEVFPNFELLVYGGVNFEPYQSKLYKSIGAEVNSMETYPASEGFIAYQDSLHEEGLWLNLNSGIFFEFIPVDEYFNERPTRLTIKDVQVGVNYALIINSNAGLWGYSIGDTVKFVSLNPPRLIVTGRIKHFISAFGEHVIGEEVEKAMSLTIAKFPETEIVEFTVAPMVSDIEGGKSYHEWLIAFAQEPVDLEAFKLELDQQLCKLNTYYNDLITGNILDRLTLTRLKSDAFIEYMKGIGKLGGQNKVPRLSNDRNIADVLQNHKI